MTLQEESLSHEELTTDNGRASPFSSVCPRLNCRHLSPSQRARLRGFLEEAVPSEDGYITPRKKNVLDAFVTKATIRGAAEALDAIFIELEMRGNRVHLSSDTITTILLSMSHSARSGTSTTGVRMNGVRGGRRSPSSKTPLIGLTLFELTEHVRVRRTGADRYVCISDLSPMRRYAPPGSTNGRRARRASSSRW
jgi:hypothetical protein